MSYLWEAGFSAAAGLKSQPHVKIRVNRTWAWQCLTWFQALKSGARPISVQVPLATVTCGDLVRERVHSPSSGYASLSKRATKLSGPKCFSSCLDLCACLLTELYPTLCDPMDCSPSGSSVHGICFPDENTGVGCHFLLRGLFLTPGSNPHLLYLLHWPADS